MDNSTEIVYLNLSKVDWLSMNDIITERESTFDIEVSRLIREYLEVLRQ